MHGVTPRPGRVVIWDSSILRLTRPPSVSQKQGQVLLHVQFSKSKQKMVEEHDKWLAFWNDRLEAKKTWYLPEYKESSEKPLVPNVADHVVANYSTLKVFRRLYYLRGMNGTYSQMYKTFHPTIPEIFVCFRKAICIWTALWYLYADM